MLGSVTQETRRAKRSVPESGAGEGSAWVFCSEAQPAPRPVGLSFAGQQNGGSGALPAFTCLSASPQERAPRCSPPPSPPRVVSFTWRLLIC